MAEGWRPNTPPLTARDIPMALSDRPAMVVYFWAPWNGIDRLFAPVLDVIQTEYEEFMGFRSANVDDEELKAFCEECGVVNVPTLACFLGGRLIKTVVGARHEKDLRAEFAVLLGRPLISNKTLESKAGQSRFRRWLSILWRLDQ